MENEGEEKSGEKGKENAGTKEEEEGKAAGCLLYTSPSPRD